MYGGARTVSISCHPQKKRKGRAPLKLATAQASPITCGSAHRSSPSSTNARAGRTFWPMPNQLFYGDNLDVLRRHVRDETVDLVYLDPPFNSNANYNVLFAAKDGHQSAAQIQAFEDTWRWDEGAARQFSETVEAGGSVADVLLAFERFLGTNDMLA